MKRLISIVSLCVSACSSAPEIDPQAWTCEQLVKPVIEMSQQHEAQIIEITHVEERQNLPGSSLSCAGNAEWSQGDGFIEFGARVTDGNHLVIEYNRK